MATQTVKYNFNRKDTKKYNSQFNTMYTAAEQLSISKEGLDEVILDLYNQIDTILTILNKIKYKVVDINEYFTGSTANAYQERLNKYISQMGLIKDNLNTYTSDLMFMKQFYSKIDDVQTRKVENKIEDVDKQTNSFEEVKIDTSNIQSPTM
jgi:uncharacterized protein YukE